MEGLAGMAEKWCSQAPTDRVKNRQPEEAVARPPHSGECTYAVTSRLVRQNEISVGLAHRLKQPGLTQEFRFTRLNGRITESFPGEEGLKPGNWTVSGSITEY